MLILSETNQMSQCDNRMSQCDNQMSQCDNQMSQCDNRMSQCDNQMSQCDNRMSQCDNRMSQCDNQMSQCDNQMSQCDNRMSQCDNRMSRCDNMMSRCDNMMSQCDNMMSQCDNMIVCCFRSVDSAAGTKSIKIPTQQKGEQKGEPSKHTSSRKQKTQSNQVNTHSNHGNTVQNHTGQQQPMRSQPSDTGKSRGSSELQETMKVVPQRSKDSVSRTDARAEVKSHGRQQGQKGKEELSAGKDCSQGAKSKATSSDLTKADNVTKPDGEDVPSTLPTDAKVQFLWAKTIPTKATCVKLKVNKVKVSTEKMF